MTTNTAARTTRKHADGGTYETLQLAETRNRWAIAITRWTTYRGQILFEVLRVSPDNKTIRLNLLKTETEARAYANVMWKRDR